jgi:hypothetical protein
MNLCILRVCLLDEEEHLLIKTATVWQCIDEEVANLTEQSMRSLHSRHIGRVCSIPWGALGSGKAASMLAASADHITTRHYENWVSSSKAPKSVRKGGPADPCAVVMKTIIPRHKSQHTTEVAP